MIRFEKFTVKAQEAMQAAQSVADQHNHQAVEPEHLLLALLQQREGVVGPVLAKLGARPDVIQRALEQALERLPKVRGGGGQPYIGERLRAALERAQAEAERLKDEYVSTEHLLIGIPTPTPRRSTRRCSATPATSPSWRARASSIPSSAATRRSAASSRCSRAARRTIPC